jgi:carbonic anhydrase/acetyltransferase-like protein (isoleucine patch superfamily)
LGDPLGRSAPKPGPSDAVAFQIVIIEHRGQRPEVHPSAWIAPTAVVSGRVVVGPDTRVLHGAVVTAEGDVGITVGRRCVVMEQAVLRAAGRFPLVVGDQVLVGPHAYLTGCTIGSRSFIATAAMVFNGAVLGQDGVVALGGKVHIGCELPDGYRVPMGYIAAGQPGTLFAPDDAELARSEVARLDFMAYVFGVESADRPRAEVMDEAMTRYTSALAHHADDVIIAPS